jgi:hypothetical protein
MVLSKREKYIGLATAAAVALLALDSFALTPYVARRDAIAAGRADAVRQLSDAASLTERQTKLRPIWTELQKGGLKVNPSQAESQTIQAVIDWAKAAGIELAALKPERSSQEGQFQVISFNVTGTGSMQAASKLLWSIETATIPVRVNDMQVTPRREGTDDLSIRLSVSALCMPPTADNSPDKSPGTTPPSTRGARS